jgi:spoIIIJ-associated protein
MSNDQMIEFEDWVDDYITGLLQLAGIDVAIEELAIDENDTLRIILGGDDSARAIGREGQMLDAIQHLVVSSAIHNGYSGRRILVDVEGYRERHESKLIEEAQDAAQDALETGKSQDFAPMPPRERRLIHVTVSKIDGVISESHGRGDERFVRVVPSENA